MPDLETMRKASELLQKGRYEDAVAEYRAILETSRKKNPALLNLIGDIHSKQSAFDRAFDAYLEACRLYAEEGLFHNAIAVGKKILRMDREQIEIYGILGNLYARQGLGGDCVKFLREFSGRKEEAGEYPAALAGFAEACEVLKNFPDVHIEYGEMLEKVDRADDAAACYREAARIWADRGLTDRADECTKRAAALGGEEPADSAANMKEIMSLRTLDDSPTSSAAPDPSPEGFWGRKDRPAGLHLDPPPLDPGSPSGASPWVRYDPAKNPELPPPPPLPPRKKGAPAAPAVPAASREEVVPVADPNAMFAEPEGLEPTGPSMPAAGPSSTAPPARAPSTGDDGLELLIEFGAGPVTPPAEEETVDLAALPGVVMPSPRKKPEPAGPEPPSASVPKAQAAAPEPRAAFGPEPPPLSPRAPGAPPAAAPPAAAPAASLDDELAAFFESTSSESSSPEQAVVIGDDLGLIEGGDVSDVIADFRAATLEILDLDDHQSHYDLGTTYMEMELFEEAAAEFEIAARGSDFALPSQEMLGYCFLRKGQIDLAICELEKGLALPAHDERAKLGLLYNLGIACSVLDRDEEAIHHFRRILEVDPDFRDTPTRLERLVQSSS